MAVKTWTELRAYVQAKFLENFDKDITGEHLRIFLTDLVDTITSEIASGTTEVRRGSVYVTTAGFVVTYDLAFSDLNYEIVGQVWVDGNPVIHSESDKTQSSIKITPSENGIYRYMAIPNP